MSHPLDMWSPTQYDWDTLQIKIRRRLGREPDSLAELTPSERAEHDLAKDRRNTLPL